MCMYIMYMFIYDFVYLSEPIFLFFAYLPHMYTYFVYISMLFVCSWFLICTYTYMYAFVCLCLCMYMECK